MSVHPEQVARHLRDLHRNLHHFRQQGSQSFTAWEEIQQQCIAVIPGLPQLRQILPKMGQIYRFVAGQVIETLREIGRTAKSIRAGQGPYIQLAGSATYRLKDGLLELMLEIPESDLFRCEVGLATDIANMLSMRITTPQWRVVETSHHWPFNLVSVAARYRIQLKCGSFPPP